MSGNNDIESNTNPPREYQPPEMDPEKSRFPYCIVWTPIPILTYLLPVIGHMGIAMSSGIIRDFAAPYYVAENDMAFGKPTKYWLMNPDKVKGGRARWDSAVTEASEIYKGRVHNLCCDNCHSHVAMALNLMQYDGSNSWNMVKLWFYMLIYSKYVNFWAFLKTWIPFFVTIAFIAAVLSLLKYL